MYHSLVSPKNKLQNKRIRRYIITYTFYSLYSLESGNLTLKIEIFNLLSFSHVIYTLLVLLKTDCASPSGITCPMLSLTDLRLSILRTIRFNYTSLTYERLSTFDLARSYGKYLFLVMNKNMASVTQKLTMVLWLKYELKSLAYFSSYTGGLNEVAA